MINTAEHVRKLRDEQTQHDQTRLQYDEFLKSLVYKWNEESTILGLESSKIKCNCILYVFI